MRFKTNQIQIIGPKDKAHPGHVFVSTVSKSEQEWSRELSPFFLGPVELYDGFVSKTMENAWQFSKVYPDQVDENKNPTKEYWNWANQGWANPVAQRYPKSKGAKPLYCLFDKERLSYVEARLKVYFKLYQKVVSKTAAFEHLLGLLNKGTALSLFDYDGYDEVAENLTLSEVFLNPNRKAGHAFVIKSMLLYGEDCNAWELFGPRQEQQLSLFD